jgi:hypothetical protein
MVLVLDETNPENQLGVGKLQGRVLDGCGKVGYRQVAADFGWAERRQVNPMYDAGDVKSFDEGVRIRYSNAEAEFHGYE